MYCTTLHGPPNYLVERAHYVQQIWHRQPGQLSPPNSSQIGSDTGGERGRRERLGMERGEKGRERQGERVGPTVCSGVGGPVPFRKFISPIPLSLSEFLSPQREATADVFGGRGGRGGGRGGRRLFNLDACTQLLPPPLPGTLLHTVYVQGGQFT